MYPAGMGSRRGFFVCAAPSPLLSSNVAGDAGGGIGALGIVLSERGPGDPPQALWPVVGAAYFGVPGAPVGLLTTQRRWEHVALPVRAGSSGAASAAGA